MFFSRYDFFHFEISSPSGLKLRLVCPKVNPRMLLDKIRDSEESAIGGGGGGGGRFRGIASFHCRSGVTFGRTNFGSRSMYVDAVIDLTTFFDDAVH